MSFPATLPSYTISSGAETLNGAAGGTGLSGVLNAFETDITGLGTKMGTGASTPTAGKVLRASGTGTSAWAQVAMASDMAAFSSADLAGVVSDETGSGALVFGTSPTIVTPTIASFTNAQHTHANAAGGGAIALAGLPNGICIQQVSSLTSAVATGTTIIPFDDTIPQNTEGDQYLSLAITPNFSTSTLEIVVAMPISNSNVSSNEIMALFQDSTANALAAQNAYNAAAGGPVCLVLQHTMTAGTTSSTTFKVRAGGSSAGTTTVNGQASTRAYGAIPKSSIIIREYKG